MSMHFGPWHPVVDSSQHAPDCSGVVQMRAEGILDYKLGRSAMVFYACSAPGETLRAYVDGPGAALIQQAQEQGACWIRFGESLDAARDLSRLLKRFAERFGTPPLGNTSQP